MRVALLRIASAMLVLLGAAAASAQTYPVSGPLPMPFIPLPSTATQSPSGFNSMDWYYYEDGMWSVQLPSNFTFRYWGTTYSYVRIGGNGGIIPANSSSPGYGYYDTYYTVPYWSYGLPMSWQSLGIIAPWWDDWARSADSPHPGGISYEVVGTAPNRVLKVEWKNLSHYSCGTSNTTNYYMEYPDCGDQRSFSFQVWIFEAPSSGSTNSTILFNYATPIGPPPASAPNAGVASGFTGTDQYHYYAQSGVVGMQDGNGYNAVMPPGFTTCSSYYTHWGYGTCDIETQWPSNQSFIFGTIAEIELMGAPGLNSFASTATDLALDLNTTVYNIGETAASNVGWDLYLSTDQSLNTATDTALTAANVPAIHAVAGRSSTAASSQVTIARPADAWYYICANVDPTNVVSERVEGNNGGCSSTPFLVGKDLVGSISPPAAGAPGENIMIPMRIENLGSDPVGTFTYEVYFSLNDTFDLGDEKMHQGTITLGGSGVYENNEPVWVPANISGNLYHVILVIDRAGVAPELDDTNNIAVSPAKMQLIKPDLKPDAVLVDAGFGCYFGQSVSVSYEVCNSGVGNAWNFINATFLSSNAVITGNDVQTDASPQSCNSGLDSECADIGAGQPFCYLGACHAPCESDFDCGDPGLICAPDRDVPLIRSCQQHIGPESCKTYTREFTIPTHDRNGFIMEEGEYFIGVIADATDRVNEENEGNQIKAYAHGFECRHPRSDLTPVSVVPASRMAAGEVSSVYRVIQNVGNVGGTGSYRYMLSSNETISTDDIPLEIAGIGVNGSATVDAFGEQKLSDLVMVPDNVVPGEYYLGILVDPDDQLRELDEANNVLVASTKVTVEAAALRILSSSIPDAMLRARYIHQLVARGGTSEYQWALTSGNLPLGMTLDATGRIEGEAADEGTYVFEVTVTSGGAKATRLLALRVGPPMGNLAVATEGLPPAVVDVAYETTFAALGGQPPYETWVVVSGLQGLNEIGMAVDGRSLKGTPIRSGSFPFTVQVTDAIGNTALRELTFTVVDSADLVIISQRFNEGQVGLDYFGCASASGGAEGEYVWTVESDTVPSGLAVSPNGTRVCLTGEPQVCGSFTVDVTVQDESGQMDAAQLPMTIVCERIGLATTSLPSFQRGEAVDTQLEATAEGTINMRTFAGRLPDGVTLESDGRLVGTVGESASVGTYNFVVEVTTDVGGYGLSALSLTVLPDPLAKPKVVEEEDTGCSAAGGSPAGLLPLGMALLGLATLRRRRD